MNRFFTRFVFVFIAAAALDAGAQPAKVTFKDFRSYDLERKQATPALKSLDGKKVTVVGFMMPFDSIEKIDRFMFLQAPFAGCFHLPPPQAHETILVESAGLSINYDQYPQQLEGVLSIKETVIEGFLISVYTIKATAMKRADMSAVESNGLPPGAHMGGDF